MPNYTDPIGRGLEPVTLVNDGVDSSASATGAASAIAPALAADANATWFCTGFEITGGGATAASIITATLAGLVGGTMSFNIPVPAGATAGIYPLVVEFGRPIPATGVNTAVTLSVPSFGAGNTNSAAVLHGFKRPV